MFLKIVILIALICATPVFGASLYVSPSGSESACTEGSPCTLRTANASVAAGDTVYMMDGTYAHTTSGPYCGICPAVSGQSDAKITYTKYAGATPIITLGDDNYAALKLSDRDYIVVDGITVHDNYRWAYVMNGSDYNEIKNCLFYNTTKKTNQGFFIYGYVSGSDYSNGSTHNWVHGNTFYNLYLSPCSEGGDIIRVGSASNGDGSNM
jgi:hypothetical protein